ncbi:hypothetical protein N7478_012197 [Penicillium angulare]|uniref:uncharacterized protein n=1 Tax=Penicillium angulare TaxID=116970 RepID=UPI00253FAA83|nr:uncharacterized protein N7478_012197 [Penicillium angulare]KAJ5259216.1 hypothetical protein N7478_012197 [Penicillium angulare]
MPMATQDRIDPAIGGYTSGNTLAYTETYPLPHEPSLNPHGNGYISNTQIVEKSGDLDIETQAGRTFSIQNPNILNRVDGKPFSYKINAPPMQKLLASPDSYHFKRAEFADHEIYVTKYKEDELFSGVKFTNQSRGRHGIKR